MKGLYLNQEIKEPPHECPVCGRPFPPSGTMHNEAGFNIPFFWEKFQIVEKKCPNPEFDGPTGQQIAFGCGWKKQLVFPWNGITWDESEFVIPKWARVEVKPFNRFEAVRRQK